MKVRSIVCNNAIEAESLRSRLMEEGIECLSYDEANSKVARGVLNSTVEVWVKEEDYARAETVYKSMMEEQDNFTPWCPKCGSEDVVALSRGTDKKGLSALLAGILLFLPLGGSTSNTQYECRQCGHKWKR